MLRVLFILPNVCGGGAERVVLSVLRHLDRTHFQPILFLTKNEGILWDEIPADTKVFYGMQQGLKLKWHLFEVLRRLLYAARDADIIVGSLEYDSIYLASLAGWLLRRPVVGWTHVEMFNYPKRILIDHVLPRLLYPGVNLMLTVSQGVSQSLERQYPWLKSRIRTAYNPLDLVLIDNKRNETLDEYFQQDIPVVLGVGRLVTQKNFSLLIRAHAMLLARGIRQELVIIGEGPERASLEELACKLGVQDSVRLPGFLLNPYPNMCKASCLVLSSQYEGWGSVVLEAMALGVPTIVVNCLGSGSEVVGDGEYGLLIPPNDLEAMVDAIMALLTDPKLARHYMLKGRERAEQFGIAHRIPVYERLLLEARQSSASGENAG
ncbi:MAG: glycosyltransferase [Syntrophomonadaceae bacterium]|nr:glycosyltransferase [Syntrophomonadaceae bacterium]